jgi:hypothetical protein
VIESAEANNVTSCHSPVMVSTRKETMRSVPPYVRGGTLSISGDTWAIRILGSAMNRAVVLSFLHSSPYTCCS